MCLMVLRHIPPHVFRLLVDPVRTPGGHVYERSVLAKALAEGRSWRGVYVRFCHGAW